MSFPDDLKRWTREIEQTTNTIFVNTCAAALDSIQNGSAVTGSPGQPVDTGALRASWQLEFESPTSALISTNSEYAYPNEYGVTEDGRPYVQKSPVGGRFSVALTGQGLDRIIADEARKVTGA